MSSTIQQPRLDRSYSTSSASSSGSNEGWLVLNAHGASTVTTPNAVNDAFNPFLQLAPVTRGASIANKTFRATENAEDRQRLFLLRARDN